MLRNCPFHRLRQNLFGLGNYTASGCLRIVTMVWQYIKGKKLNICIPAIEALDGDEEFFVLFGCAVALQQALSKEVLCIFYGGDVDLYNPSHYDHEVRIWWLGVALGIFAAIVHWPIQENPVIRQAAA